MGAEVTHPVVLVGGPGDGEVVPQEAVRPSIMYAVRRWDSPYLGKFTGEFLPLASPKEDLVVYERRTFTASFRPRGVLVVPVKNQFGSVIPGWWYGAVWCLPDRWKVIDAAFKRFNSAEGRAAAAWQNYWGWRNDPPEPGDDRERAKVRQALVLRRQWKRQLESLLRPKPVQDRRAA